MFRALSDTERQTISKQVDRGRVNFPWKLDEVNIAYTTNKNFTVAVLLIGETGLLTGVAKRNPNDNPNPEIGQTIALCRAISSEPVQSPGKKRTTRGKTIRKKVA